MVIPAVHTVKVYANDSFDFELNWEDGAGNTVALATWDAQFLFYISKSDNTVLKAVPKGGFGTRVTLTNTFPNISVFVEANETGIGAAPDFSQAPGWYILRVAPVLDMFDTTTDRLIMGKVRYVP